MRTDNVFQGIFLLLTPVILLVGCTAEEKPISYGTDICAHCDMTIMDPRYGAEAVTEKGKVYMFDSIECLIGFLEHSLPDKEVASLLLVTSYDQPHKLVDAHTCYFIRTRALPSPMGMYLTAFETQEAAQKARETYGGRLYDWYELLGGFDQLKTTSLK